MLDPVEEVAVLVLDDERRYIDVTREACRLLGRSREEILSMRAEDLSDSDPAIIKRKWQRFLREGFAAGTSSFRLPNGGTLKVRYTCMAHVPNPGMHLEKLTQIR